MKKIINNKVYDTNKATEIGTWESGRWGDLDHVAETLYQKRTGEFFLHGEGGPQTKYAMSVGQGNWSGSEQIIPLAWENAREWAESHLEAKAYEKAFGEVAEDESRTTVTLSLSAGAVETAKRAAAQAGVSLSAYIESLIK